MSPTSTWCCPTTPPVSTTARTTSPRKRRLHGKPPSAGTTSTQSSGSPKFERSEQRQRIERPRLCTKSRLLAQDVEGYLSNDSISSADLDFLCKAACREQPSAA